jgi:hypothetical protein
LNINALNDFVCTAIKNVKSTDNNRKKKSIYCA